MEEKGRRRRSSGRRGQAGLTIQPLQNGAFGIDEQAVARDLEVVLDRLEETAARLNQYDLLPVFAPPPLPRNTP